MFMYFIKYIFCYYNYYPRDCADMLLYVSNHYFSQISNYYMTECQKWFILKLNFTYDGCC